MQIFAAARLVCTAEPRRAVDADFLLLGERGAEVGIVCADRLVSADLLAERKFQRAFQRFDFRESGRTAAVGRIALAAMELREQRNAFLLI